MEIDYRQVSDMEKLYVFGIGGTGSRVLRALTMLLSCGVECAAKTIVPIIIDPDDSAADMTRTIDVMNRYGSIRKRLDFSSNEQNMFFRTEIRSVPEMNNFRFTLQNTRDCCFRDFINVNAMSRSSAALVHALFSEKNLNSDMKVGFKGNPNIGSVVLNQFAGSSEYGDFANDFQQGDRIFIIGSIFGGTGASGFPLLLKTLRSDRTSQKWKLISEARIGAVSVLPYFNVTQDENSGVDSSTFISKTKSALAYYGHNISGNASIDALYYIGDNVPATYDNHDGGSMQKNNAHFIELCSALAILDFAASGDKQFSNDRGTLHYEFGIDTNDPDISQIIFGNLGEKSKKLLQKPMTQFLLMQKYLQNKNVKDFVHQPWAIDNNFDETFFSGDFYNDIKIVVCNHYHQWLKEMDENVRSFKPFDEDKIKPLFDTVKGQNPRKYNFHITRDYALMDSILNGCGKKISKAIGQEQKFAETFYFATKDLVEHKYIM